jgi:hypothetical protein
MRSRIMGAIGARLLWLEYWPLNGAAEARGRLIERSRIRRQTANSDM